MITKTDIVRILNSSKASFLEVGIRHVGLFGSYLRGKQNSESDIDLLIEFEPEKETFDNFMAACDLLENLFAGTKIEVVTKNGLSPYIGPKILAEVQYV